MKINKLTASFGKLNGETLELNDGLNIICAPNESGKSTWCAFIRAMLYGIDSSERQKSGYLPDKLRYVPWSGAPMQGEMEVSVDGKDITLIRTTKLKSAPMREFTAVYTGTNVQVEGMTGTNAGEMLTGASREVFRRSAFVEQGGITVSGSPELEKRIAAIVSSGDEDCSFSEADEQLRAWQRKRRYNRRGKLPELEEEMLKTKNKLEELRLAADEGERLNDSLTLARKKCAELENKVTESRKLARKEALTNLQNTRKELNAANEAHERADDARDAARAALCGCIIGEREPDEVKAELQESIKTSTELKMLSEKKSSAVPAVIMFVISIVAAIFGVMLNKLIFVGTVVFAALGVLLILHHKKSVDAAHNAGRQRRKILARYKAESEDDIRTCEAEYLELYSKFTEAENEERRTAEILAKAKARQERTEAETLAELDFSGGDNKAAHLSREYITAQQDCDRISGRISEIKGRINTIGDPLVLGSELKRMEDEYEELRSEYDAIGLAISTLRAADEDIQSRFSPELGKTAAHYMSMVTGGRYEALLINRDFTARTRAGGDSVARETAYLSAGTLDLLYLAVRLAVCKLALPENSNCPLILDDTLVNLDAERTKQALKLLKEIAKTRQVVLFTCKSIE